MRLPFPFYLNAAGVGGLMVEMLNHPIHSLYSSYQVSLILALVEQTFYLPL
jgi:hypothetical protein